jgi:pyruvate dehydrogenase E2 component (dihydrolipoamide acetyltransferase)
MKEQSMERDETHMGPGRALGHIIVMPQMGYDMREGRLIRWLKGEGDEVAQGDEVAEIETDKAVVTITATASGVLRRILVEEGAMVPVGTAIGLVAGADEAIPERLGQLTGQVTTPAADEVAAGAGPGTQSPQPLPDDRVRSSPLARRIARERGVDISQVVGTGPRGRIVERDVLAHPTPASPTAAAPAAPGPTQRLELSRMRQAIARVTSRSMQEVPHFYVTSEVDMTEAVRFRRGLNAAQDQDGPRVGINDLIIKACALALAKHPTINSSFVEEALDLHSAINIGIAVDLEERGLIIPTLVGCEARSLMDIAAGSHDLVQRAKGDRLRAEELSGSTFTISNMGTLDVDSFTAIIFQPNSAVLAVGAIKDQAVVRGGEVMVARLMKMTLSLDHRAIDGAAGARFIRDVKRHLEHPEGMKE